MSLKNLYLTVTVGEAVRDYLVLRIIDRVLDLLPKYRVVVLTPSYLVPEFLALCPQTNRVEVRRMELAVAPSNRRLVHWRLKVRGRRRTQMFLGLEARRVRLPQYLARTFDEFPPDLVVTTHPKISYEYEVVTWARRLGVQTLGIVKSWDNVGKGLESVPHLLSVWNPVNKEEAQELLGYRDDEVEINGCPCFDAYYDTEFILTRDEFLRSLGLDPERPLITLATGGVMNRGFYGRDETHLVDDVLRIIRSSRCLNGAQLVVRLHPASHLEYFWRYFNQPDIALSFSSYMPGIMWFTDREDLIEQANLLRYSDVVVTPASSWTLEAAIFDTPTVVPVYSETQPDHAVYQFDEWTLKRHFKPLALNDWVPVTRSYLETQTAIEEAFAGGERYKIGRKAIVDSYVYYRDGGSRQRIAKWIASIAADTSPARTKGI